MHLPNFFEDDLYLDLIRQMRISSPADVLPTEMAFLFNEEGIIQVESAPSSRLEPAEEVKSPGLGLIETVTTFFRFKEKKPTLKLDTNKLNEVSKATEELFDFVSQAIQEDIHFESQSQEHRSDPLISELLRNVFPANTEHLDTKYHELLVALLQKQNWTTEDFIQLTRKHHLMPSAAIDVINGWSDEFLGEYLLNVDSSPYTVNMDLLPAKGGG